MNNIWLVQKKKNLFEKFKTNTSINNPITGVHASLMKVSSAASHQLNEIIKMPWSLKKIDSGSFNPGKLVNLFINQILPIKPVSENAYTKVTIKNKEIATENKNNLTEALPPDMFKLCKLSSVFTYKIFNFLESID